MPIPMSRRDMLKATGAGFGYLALRGLLAEAAAHEQGPMRMRPGHHPARAKRVIFLFMHGGPSHLDTFDYKPRLQRDDGGELPFAPAQGTLAGRRLLASPWKFARHGQSGAWVSELFPETARHVDDICFLKGMHTEGQSHGQAVMKLHTGNQNLPRPSMGAWVLYGLGTENQSLPGFVTICPPTGHGGALNYGNAFLPAVYQGTPLGRAGVPASRAAIRNLTNDRLTLAEQRRRLDLLQTMNRGQLQAGGQDQLDAVIESYELAFRMQDAVPRIMDLNVESRATKALYGIDQTPTDDFGRQCLLARRFAEAGVRFIEVTSGYKWDQHDDLKCKHAANAREVDRPIAALLTDLKARGLLDDTLVLWGGEFGRTPVTEPLRTSTDAGRDHNPQGFTMWLAGGGVRGGLTYGATDEFGYYAERERVHMHDLHATLLHLLGLDHERLTYRYAGRDFRLTDVYGRVVEAVLS
jgi:uncharacterized protein (DUF1501 family)